MAKTNTIITIGRQFGSGGHDIGTKLAEELDIKFYDKEMLDRAAKDSGICQELFESNDEKPTNSFLYSLVMDTYSFGNNYASGYLDMPLNHKIFLAQFDAIKGIAAEGSCVLIGRCADYALEDRPDVLRIFIRADLNDRIRRVAKQFDLSNAKAKDMIIKTDKKRAGYYNYYSNKKWGDSESYDFCLNSSILGIDGAVDAIKALIELKEKNIGVKL